MAYGDLRNRLGVLIQLAPASRRSPSLSQSVPRKITGNDIADRCLYQPIKIQLDGTELFVNPDHIVKCHPDIEGTRVVLSNGEGHLVTESVEEVNRCSKP